MFDSKEYKKQHYIDNIEKYKKRNKEWNKKNPKYAKEYHKNNREKRLKQMESWREDNHKHIKAYSKEYRGNNILKIEKAQRNWLKNNPIYWKQYLKDNRKKINEYENGYKKNKRRIDPRFRLDCNMAYMVWKGLKGNKAGRKWLKFVDYSIDKLMKHLEKQFTPEMDWNNYGIYWVVDHIIPRSKFNYIEPEHFDFKKCWSLKNLRPLEIRENLIKSNKLTKPFQPALQI